MKTRALVILDFDRTIISPEFYLAFISLLTKKGLIDDRTSRNVEAVIADPKKTIDLQPLLDQGGLTTTQALDLARNELDENNFIFPDVAALIERVSDEKIIIMTSGHRRWQLVKLGFCSSLDDYTKIILEENKGQYIRETLIRRAGLVTIQDLAGEWFNEIVLVDDRVESLTPLIGESLIQLWHIERPGAKYKRLQDHDGISHVTSLDDISLKNKMEHA